MNTQTQAEKDEIRELWKDSGRTMPLQYWNHSLPDWSEWEDDHVPEDSFHREDIAVRIKPGHDPREKADATSPRHYSEGMPEGVEVIDVIRAQNASYTHGNVIKYILRWKYKNGVGDLKKAAVYLQWLIEEESK